jgi:alpha-amylase
MLCSTTKVGRLTLLRIVVNNVVAGADKTERCKVVKVDPDNRNQKVSDEFEIDGWLGFDFPGRGNKHSSQKYHWYHFSATDYDDSSKETALYQIQGDGKHWATDVRDTRSRQSWFQLTFLNRSILNTATTTISCSPT